MSNEPGVRLISVPAYQFIYPSTVSGGRGTDIVELLWSSGRLSGVSSQPGLVQS